MAKTDLTGLLTGVTQAPIDPMLGATYEQRMLARGAQAAQGLRRGMGALTGADTRTTGEKAQEMLSRLDPTKPEDRVQILEVVERVNPQAAPALRQAFADRDREESAAKTTQEQAQERLDIMRMQAEASQTSAEASKLAAGGGGKLSVADRNAIRDAETAAAKARGQVDSALGMAKRYETLKPTGGFGGSVFESWKSSIGGQDEVSALKTGFTNLVNTGIIGSLPPGVASDKDIEMAKSGFPNSSWNADEIASWLRGNAKLQAYQSERSRFEAQWISDNKGDASGWNNAWDELRASEGYAQSVVDKYNLPALDLPKEDLSFDEAAFQAIQEKKAQAAQTQAQGRIAGATGGFGL
jgi:hypothetical protein